MADLFGGCNDQGVAEAEFMLTFCMRCHNKECDRARGRNKWEERISTQVERLLTNPKFADLSNPQFAQIAKKDFPSLFREAIRVEITERRGDWTPATDQDIDAVLGKGGLVDPTGLPISSGQTPAVSRTEENPRVPAGFVIEVETEEETPEPVVQPPTPTPVRNAPVQQPTRQPVSQQRLPQNTEVPAEGIMLDDSPVPAMAPPVDPWAAPADPPVHKVAVGATIRLGGGS